MATAAAIIAPLASLDVVARAFKAEHRYWHDLWRTHTRYCPRCVVGGRCRVADDLADRADVAGIRWERATRDDLL